MRCLPLKRWLRFLLTSLLGLALVLQCALPGIGMTDMTPIQAGQAHYQAGRYHDSAQALEQAIAVYRNANQPLAAARTLGLQALALAKLGRFPEANQAIDQSLSILKMLRQSSPGKAIAQSELNLVEAQVLSSQGKLLRAQGNAKTALASWTSALELYEQEKDETGILGSRLNQIKALESLGFYRRADLQIKHVAQDIQGLPNSPLKARGLLNLGNLLRLEGQLEASANSLQQALSMTASLAPNRPNLHSQLLLSLANTERLQVNRALSARDSEQSDVYLQQAIAHYEAAIGLAQDPVEKVQIQLNLLSLLGVHSPDSEAYSSLQQSITQALPKLPVSRRSIYARVNFCQATHGPCP